MRLGNTKLPVAALRTLGQGLSRTRRRAARGSLRLLDAWARRAARAAYTRVLARQEVVVYTVIIGDTDTLQQPLVVDPRVRYVLISDRPRPNLGVWEHQEAVLPFEDPRRNSRHPKILPHEAFPTADYSIYMDGTFRMNVSPLDAIYWWLGRNDIAMIRHPQRNCLYQEAAVCKQHNKDAPDVLDRQVQVYRREGYPEDNGLIAGGVILRRHTQKIRTLNQAWWQEQLEHSTRDQVSFNYVAHKLGVDYGTIPGGYWDSEFFPYTHHQRMQPRAVSDPPAAPAPGRPVPRATP